MKNLILPLGAIFGLIAFTLYRKSQTAENLRFEFDDILLDIDKTKQSKFARFYYKLYLRIVNNDTGTLKINNLNLKISVSVENKTFDFGEIVSTIPFTITPLSSQVVGFDGNIASLGVIKLLIPYITALINAKGSGNVIRTKNNKAYFVPSFPGASVEIKGFVDTNFGRVPLNIIQGIG